MQRKIKILHVLLYAHIVLALCATAFIASIAQKMAGIVPVIPITIVITTFIIFVPLPVYAKIALAKGNVTPCVWHAAITMFFLPILIPLALWQFILGLQVKKHDKE